MKSQLVPAGFEVPLTFAWSKFHLEPLGVEHNERDHTAWMSSVSHIRSTPGFSPDEEPNWPVPMTLDENRQDLVRHAEDFEQRRGFTYSILEGKEVIGCLYIYPSRDSDHDADISCWVREDRAHLDGSVRERLASWIDGEWPFSNPNFAGVGPTP